MPVNYANPELVKKSLSTFTKPRLERTFLPSDVSLAQQEQLFALSGLITPELAKTHLPMILGLVDHCTSTTEPINISIAQNIFETLKNDPELKPNPYKYSEHVLNKITPEVAAARDIVVSLIYISNGRWPDVVKYWPEFMQMIGHS